MAYHRWRWPRLYDERLPRDVEWPATARRHLRGRPLQHSPSVVEGAPIQTNVGWARDDDVELPEEAALLLEEPGQDPAENEGPHPLPVVFIPVDHVLQGSRPHGDSEAPVKPPVGAVAERV